jgi:hypothetical protein
LELDFSAMVYNKDDWDIFTIVWNSYFSIFLISLLLEQ